MSTQETNFLAQAAQASYVFLQPGQADQELSERLQTELGSFSLTQANRFAAT